MKKTVRVLLFMIVAALLAVSLSLVNDTMDESIITAVYEDYAREDDGELPDWVANYPGLTGMKPPSEDNGYHEIETKYIMTYNFYFEKD